MFGVHHLGSIEFVFSEAEGDRSEAEILDTLTHALQLISAAKGGFGELVTSHLRMVGASKVPRPYVSPKMRAYITSFSGNEGDNSQYLACTLVWAATYLRLALDAIEYKKAFDREALHRASFDAQLRFVRQLDDGDEWSRYLLEHHPDSPNRKAE